MSNPLLLENNDRAPASAHSTHLEERVSILEQEIESLRSELALTRKECERAILKMLSPLYKALRPIYGEADPIAGLDGGSNGSKWDAIKQRLAPRMREAVDILLMQGSMKRTQLAAALKMDYSNCTKNVVGILLRQGWLVDNGGNLSLKEL